MCIGGRDRAQGNVHEAGSRGSGLKQETAAVAAAAAADGLCLKNVPRETFGTIFLEKKNT